MFLLFILHSPRKPLVATLAALALFCTAARADDDEAQRIAALKAAIKTGMAGGQCVPRESVYIGDRRTRHTHGPLEYELVFSTAGNDLLMCALLSGRELAGCWVRDARSGKFIPQTRTPQTLVPGHGIKEDACGQFGFCRPNTNPGDPSDYNLIATPLDGKHVAVLEGRFRQVAVYDAASKKFLYAFDYSGETLGSNSIDNAPIKAHYIADTLFILGADAGPFATVHRFRTEATRGVSLGPLYMHRGEHFNVYDGEVRLRDSMHLTARDRGYVEVTINAASGKTEVKPLPRPAACTPKQFDTAADDQSGYDTKPSDPDATKAIGVACIKAIMQAKKRHWKPIPFVHQGQAYDIDNAGNKRQLNIRYAATGALISTVNLPLCGARNGPAGPQAAPGRKTWP